MNCNVCGKEFDEKDLVLKNTEDGTQYYTCTHCENQGVAVNETTEYYICMECGYPHQKDEFKGVCKFCEKTDCFEKTDLTEVEAELLDTDPHSLYAEKLGKDAASRIAQWSESAEKKAVDVRHKRDMQIDGTFVVGIILGYILLEMNIRNHITQKYLFLTLLIPTILIIITAPIFKKIDRKPCKKHLPIWIILVIMAVLTDIYYIITKIFA